MALINENSVVKISDDGQTYIIDDTYYVAVAPAPGNSAYDEVAAWLADGNTPEPEFTDAQRLNRNRRIEIAEIKAEAVRRIGLVIEEIETLEQIQTIAAIWPVLDNPAGNADLALARDIYVYARTRINQARTATQAQLDAYDATTDNGWPS